MTNWYLNKTRHGTVLTTLDQEDLKLAHKFRSVHESWVESFSLHYLTWTYVLVLSL